MSVIDKSKKQIKDASVRVSILLIFSELLCLGILGEFNKQNTNSHFILF